MWHVTSDTWHVTRDMWHVTRDMWHVTRDTLGGVNILSKFQLHSSNRLCFMILWRSGGKWWLTDLMNELINHEAVYRTAPATPGLFKNVSKWKLFTKRKRKLDVITKRGHSIPGHVDMGLFLEEVCHLVKHLCGVIAHTSPGLGLLPVLQQFLGDQDHWRSCPIIIRIIGDPVPSQSSPWSDPTDL